MKAVRFHQYGGPEVMRYEDAPDPVAGPGQVLVRVAGSAFNPVDDGIRGGYLKDVFPVSLPHVPGADVSGTVVAVGAGVTSPAVGDAVVGFLPMTEPGSAAELVVAPAEALTAAPAGIPLTDAAALPSVALTARQALFDDAGLTAGQRVLVNGAGGAVGHYAIQLARLAGAHVIATASPRSRARVEAAGAHEVLDHTAGPVVVDEPVDVLLNLARLSADDFTAMAAHVRDGGVVVNTVPTIPTPSDASRGVRAVGVFVRSDAARLAELVTLVDRGELHVEVTERLPLRRLPEVNERADAEGVSGKVVLVPEAE